MDTSTTITIGLLLSLVGGLVGYLTYLQNMKKNVKEDTKEDTKSKVELNAKIDVLLSNNTEIKGSVKELNKKLDTFKDDVNIRLTRVEESCKQAHKRIDIIDERKGR